MIDDHAAAGPGSTGPGSTGPGSTGPGSAAASAAAALTCGIGLLERALSYTLGGLLLVTPDAMARPTPCRGWDLRALLAHMNDSLAALHEAIVVGRVDLDPPVYGPDTDPVASLRNRACRLLGDWAAAHSASSVSIGGHPVTSGLVASAGALEVAAHGWDVARACGDDRPIPPALAEELLDLAELFVGDADRPARFAPPVPVSPYAAPGDRLVAVLGRRPA